MFSRNGSSGSKITSRVAPHSAVNWWMVIAQAAEQVVGGWSARQPAPSLPQHTLSTSFAKSSICVEAGAAETKVKGSV